MLLRYSYRLYPTPGQQVSLAKAFGCARLVFNDARFKGATVLLVNRNFGLAISDPSVYPLHGQEQF